MRNDHRREEFKKEELVVFLLAMPSAAANTCNGMLQSFQFAQLTEYYEFGRLPFTDCRSTTFL